MPSPSKRSGSRRISARARWPVTTATTLARNGAGNTPRMPVTRLITARALVCRCGTFMAWDPAMTVGEGRAARTPRACRLQVELDALGERQVVGPVDGVGLPAHVRAPGVRAGFAAAAGVLLAAERAADLGAGGADIDVGDAAVRAGRRQELLRSLQALGEDRRGQSLRHIVKHHNVISELMN